MNFEVNNIIVCGMIFFCHWNHCYIGFTLPMISFGVTHFIYCILILMKMFQNGTTLNFRIILEITPRAQQVHY